MGNAETRAMLADFVEGQQVSWIEADEDHNSASVLSGVVHQVFSEGDAVIPGTDITMPATAESPIALIGLDSPHIVFLLRPVADLSVAAPVDDDAPVDAIARDRQPIDTPSDSVPMRDLASARAELSRLEGK